MSTARKQAAALHALLMERFPQAFPKDYDAILPLKLDIDADLRERLIALGEPVDPDLLRRVLANHVGRAGYLLALIHRRDGRRYDLDGKPAGEVDALARSEAVRLLGEHQKRQQEVSTRHRQHRALEQQQQRAKAERVARGAAGRRKAAPARGKRAQPAAQPGTEGRRGAGAGGGPARREAALAGSCVPQETAVGRSERKRSEGSQILELSRAAGFRESDRTAPATRSGPPPAGNSPGPPAPVFARPWATGSRARR